PPLYSRTSSLPLLVCTSLATLALVIIEPGSRSQGPWPSDTTPRRLSGNFCSEIASSVPSGRLRDAGPTKSPGLMSSMVIFLTALTPTFSGTLIFTSLPSRVFTDSTLPSKPVISPRTRVGACAVASVLANASATPVQANAFILLMTESTVGKPDDRAGSGAGTAPAAG